MRGFSFVNNGNIKVDSSGAVLVGQLELEPGSYLLWGKLSIGVNVATGYPPPAWPYTAGAAFLALGTTADQCYFGLKPEAGGNNSAVNLMCATTITRHQRARLYLQNLYPLATYGHFIRILALQVDQLAEREVGDGRINAPQDQEELLRDAIQRARLTDQTALSELLKGG